jgi:hypothetical protein
MKSTSGPQLRRMDHALLEVKKAIHAMDRELEFVIIFYDAQIESMPGNQAVKATDASIRQMFAWVDRQGDAPLTPGAPNLIDALRHTIKTIKPSTIFLLTAGDLQQDLRGLGVSLSSMGAGGEPIQVINFGALAAETYLRQISQLSGGQYQFVPDITP